MTTVIMISNDNSVIISNSEDPESSSSSSNQIQYINSESPPSKWSLSSKSSDMISSGSPESPFLQSKPVNSRVKSARKSSVSTVESDSEELNNSSSSTTSTLSSRTSGVSSGAASGSSSGNLAHWRQKEAANERKFTTLNRNQTKLKAHQVSRARSFHYVNQMPANRTISSFAPSENSAFQRLAVSKRESHPTKFVTSTPVRTIPREDFISVSESIARSRHPRQAINEHKADIKRNRGMLIPNMSSTPLGVSRGGGIMTCYRPTEDTESEHSSGVRCHPDAEYYQATRSLGRNLCSQGVNSAPNYEDTQTRGTDNNFALSHNNTRPNGRSDTNKESLCKGKAMLNMSSSQGTRNVSHQSSAAKVKNRADVSPINTNYARIYSNMNYCANEDINEFYVQNEGISSDSDYDTIYSTKEESEPLPPIGSVFPSGCHRHPSKIMIARPAYRKTFQYCDQCGKNCKCKSRLLSYKPHEISSCETPTTNRNISPNRTTSDNLSEMSVNLKAKCQISNSQANRSAMVSKAKSFDGLTAFLNKSAINDKENKFKINSREPMVPRRQKMKLSQPGKFPSLSVSKSQILRRHTTYDKTSKAVHIHSWHKQDDEIQRPKSSSLKRSVSRRSSSSSRLSLLSKKDDNEISITDAQSLDRLSLHSQEDLDEINFEKYLQSAGRAAGWAKEFDSLLSDKIGLSKFTEFLQKEFSHENIYFWCACEKYRLIENGPDRHKMAQDIMQRHLEIGAIEPVNVDSVARAATSQKLANSSTESPPERQMFTSAQRQIYNLMKFDSYPRFLKSDVYKECVRTEMNGTILADSEISTISNEASMNSCVKDESLHQRKIDSIKNKRRKSMSFWENWGKSRENLPPEQIKPDDERVRDGCTLTRVIFPDKATTVVNTTTGESIRALISRLLDKRSLKLTSFDVFAAKNEKPLDLSEDCAILHCTEVQVEARILFRLELPSHKSIGVKAKRTKSVEDVLAPILQQYGWNINEVDVYVDEDTDEGDKVDLNSNVSVIDNKRLFVVQQTSTKERFWKQTETKISKQDPEITLYEGLQIMRKGRFEDQRGTEICFEIPEFLRQPSKTICENGNSNHDEPNKLETF